MPQKGQTAARGSFTLRIVSVLSQCFDFDSLQSSGSGSVPTTEAWQMKTWVFRIRSVVGLVFQGPPKFSVAKLSLPHEIWFLEPGKPGKTPFVCIVCIFDSKLEFFDLKLDFFISSLPSYLSCQCPWFWIRFLWFEIRFLWFQIRFLWFQIRFLWSQIWFL